MADNTEAFLLAASCLSTALIGTLGRKGILSENDIAEITDSAELVLASLPPTMMSDGARGHARQILQETMKEYPLKFDSQF
jgi:hypothetical protein